MLVKELIEKLKEFPLDKKIVLDVEYDSGYARDLNEIVCVEEGGRENIEGVVIEGTIWHDLYVYDT